MNRKMTKGQKKTKPHGQVAHRESVPESFALFFEFLLKCFSVLCAVLVLGGLPFYYQDGYTHIGSDKSYFFRTATAYVGKVFLPVLGLYLVAGVAAVLLRRKQKPDGAEMRRAGVVPADFFALCYGGAAVLSWYCSRYRSTALWGTKGWYMGMVPQLAFVALYLLLSFFGWKAVTKGILYATLPVSAAVFLLGCINRFDIWPIPMAHAGLPLYISTIGNINWFCSYAVTLAFVGAGLFWMDRGANRWRTIALAVYVLLAFAALLLQGSESGIFALGVVFVLLFLWSCFAQDQKKMQRFFQLAALLAGAGSGIFALRRLFPGRMNYTSSIGALCYSPWAVCALAAAGIGYLYVTRFYAGDSRFCARNILHRLARVLAVALPVAAVVFVGMIALNTARPGSLGVLSGQRVFTFDRKWGSSRGATWTTGIRCFAEQDALHKLTGVGPDCMADFLYHDASDALQKAAREALSLRRRLSLFWTSRKISN